MSEENKALVRRWIDAVDSGNLDIADQLVAADYVDHNPPLGDIAPGREGVKEANNVLKNAFPGRVRHTILRQIAEGDFVVSHVMAKGIFAGELMGQPPTGEEVNTEGIMIHRIEGGQLVEHWALIDQLSFLTQLGVMKPISFGQPPAG